MRRKKLKAKEGGEKDNFFSDKRLTVVRVLF